jgi:hypothetical protein
MTPASRIVALFATTTFVTACGSSNPPAQQPSPASVSDKCPDVSKVDELAAFDFASEYALSRDAAEKIKAAALTAMEVGLLADKLDADFGIACAQLAHDLGNKGDWRSGNEACAAAIKALQEARAKLGPKAQVQLVIRKPLCLTDASLVTKCASICDSSVPAAKVRAECDTKAGRCEGNCTGSCQPKSAIKCDGVCSGTCEGPINGKCGGRCTGTCDGKRSSGPCLGVCVGSCERGPAVGECKGICSGSCKLAKPAICDSTCEGTCSVELDDAKCSGDFKAPEVSSDCRARCDLAVINQKECSTPPVGLVVAGAKDRESAEAMKTAVDKSLPGLLKILEQVGAEGPTRIHDAQAIIESARTGFKEMARSGDASTAAKAEAQLVKCFDQPFKKALAASATAKLGIEQALGVRDEASK